MRRPRTPRRTGGEARAGPLPGGGSARGVPSGRRRAHAPGACFGGAEGRFSGGEKVKNLKTDTKSLVKIQRAKTIFGHLARAEHDFSISPLRPAARGLGDSRIFALGPAAQMKLAATRPPRPQQHIHERNSLSAPAPRFFVFAPTARAAVDLEVFALIRIRANRRATFARSRNESATALRSRPDRCSKPTPGPIFPSQKAVKSTAHAAPILR